MDIPPEIRQKILQVRQDNPALTANMSDQDVVALLQQADEATANDRPTAFVVWPPPHSQQTKVAASDQDVEARSMDELIVIGQQLSRAGQWQAAQRALLALSRRAIQANHNMGNLYRQQGKTAQAREEYRQA